MALVCAPALAFVKFVLTRHAMSGIGSQRMRHGVAPPAGFARATGHHGEILQGVFLYAGGRLVPGLVSLPCARFKSTAWFVRTRERSIDCRKGGWLRVVTGEVRPARYAKALKAAQLALQMVESALPGSLAFTQGGYLYLRSNMTPRLGLGSSTADVVAAIRAVGNAYGVHFSAEMTARFAVDAEVASDPSMFAESEQALLFAQRDGKILEEFSSPVPSLMLLSIDTDPTGGGVDTLARSVPNYSIAELNTFADLRQTLADAIQRADLELLAAVAKGSAEINENYLPKRGFEEIARIGRSVGSLGVQVAHSGSVMGLVFDPMARDLPQCLEECEARLRQLGFDRIRRLRTGNTPHTATTPLCSG